MRVAVLSANLGGYDRVTTWPVLAAPAGVEIAVHRFTDATLPPRPLAMTSRLQCGLPKWFGPDHVPGADVYLWIDASCTPTSGAVSWFLDQLGPSEIAVFAHPERQTVRQEYEFITQRLTRRGETYLTSRYAGEWLAGDFAHCHPQARLVASTAFMYRPTPAVLAALQEVWLHKTRWCLHDQLAFSTVLASGLDVRWIPDNYLSCPALTFTRTRARS